MNGRKYQVVWNHVKNGHNSAMFDKKAEALTFARNIKNNCTEYEEILVYQIKFGCKTKIWGRIEV